MRIWQRPISIRPPHHAARSEPTHEDSDIYFDEGVKFLEVMKACHHASTSVCYGHATAAANTLDMSGFSKSYRSYFLNCTGNANIFTSISRKILAYRSLTMERNFWVR